MNSCHQPSRDCLYITLDARNLACKQNAGSPAHLQSFRQQCWRANEGVPVDLAESENLCAFQPRNEPEYPLLLPELEMVLKPDHVVTIGQQVLLPELHGCEGLPSRPRVYESGRFHGSIAQRVSASPGQFLYWKAALEIHRLLEFMQGDRFGRNERVVEAPIFFRVHGTVHVVRAAFFIAGSPKRDLMVDGFRFHDRRYCVVKVEVV